MKETLDQNIKTQEAYSASFFKIDPQNWSDIPPPVVKPFKPRSPYKLFGVARFIDPPKPFVVTSGIPPQWKISKSRLNIQMVEKHKKEKGEGERRERVRRQATELMRKHKRGQIKIDEVRDFYRSNATFLVRQKDYEMYLEDRKRILKSKPTNDRERMIKKCQKRIPKLSWREYAKLRVWEIFASDLMMPV